MGAEPNSPAQLRPDMSSRRLLVLNFITDYLTRWRASPSIGEIAAGCGIGRSRAFQHVRALARDGLIIRRRGPRGITLPATHEVAIGLLRDMGWQIDEELLLARPLPCTESTLLPGPALDYVPPSGGNEHGGQGTSDAGGAGADEGAAPGAAGDP